jgi:type IV pilus assembly protein PilB
MSIALGVAQTTSLLQTLLQEGLISNDQSRQIEFEAANNSRDISEQILLSSNVSEKAKIRAKSVAFNIPFADIINISISSEVINMISPEVARKYMAIVFEEDNALNTVKIAMVDPMNVEYVRTLSTLIGKTVQPYFANPQDVLHTIDTKYGAQVGAEVSRALKDVSGVVDISGGEALIDSLQGDISAAPVSKIVNSFLSYAGRVKASDIHIEPRETKLVVRVRVNGVLAEIKQLPLALAPAIVSRIKILANLKIDEHRVPQDGRFQVKVEQDMIDLRVSILPTVYGEKIVIRLLERGGGTMTLDQTGLIGRNLVEFQKAITKTQGIILVTGPTGSGKTVTLASCLKILNKESVNILTLEDPVEIRVDGVNQVQISPEVGLTFAKGLRSFLRQDPNIIMLGEIRDSETAELAVQAALTGHLVLATLHTNNAATAIPRLIDMNIEPFLLASTINLVAAQRLTRKICNNCKTQYTASSGELKKVKDVLSEINGFNFDNFLQKNGGKISLYKGNGCAQCNNTGYKGRLGIFEVLVISEEMRNIIIQKDSAQAIENLAIKQGMMRMMHDGFVKVLQGITTIEEVLRVVS